MPRSDAEEALLAAHERRDAAALVWIYGARADELRAAGDVDAECFYLTQAYVWALEAGMPESTALHARLLAYGREE